MFMKKLILSDEFSPIKLLITSDYTITKNKIENNSTLEGTFIKMNELKLTQVELF